MKTTNLFLKLRFNSLFFWISQMLNVTFVTNRLLVVTIDNLVRRYISSLTIPEKFKVSYEMVIYPFQIGSSKFIKLLHSCSSTQLHFIREMYLLVICTQRGDFGDKELLYSYPILNTADISHLLGKFLFICNTILKERNLRIQNDDDRTFLHYDLACLYTTPGEKFHLINSIKAHKALISQLKVKYGMTRDLKSLIDFMTKSELINLFVSYNSVFQYLNHVNDVSTLSIDTLTSEK